MEGRQAAPKSMGGKQERLRLAKGSGSPQPVDPNHLGSRPRKLNPSRPHRTLQAAELSSAPPGPGHMITQSTGHGASWSHGQPACGLSAHHPATRCQLPTAVHAARGDPVRKPTLAGPWPPARGVAQETWTLGTVGTMGPPNCTHPVATSPW